MKSYFFLCFMCLGLFIASCSHNRNAIVTVSTNVTNVKEEKLYKKISGILYNRGYQIKNSDKDLGIIQTEWYQYYTPSSDVPFDFYIQLKFRIYDNDGKLRLDVSPMLKEVNRLNAAAYTEAEIYVFTEDEYERHYNPDRVSGLGRIETAFCWGQEYLKDVLMDISKEVGRDVCDFDYKIKVNPIIY